MRNPEAPKQLILVGIVKPFAAALQRRDTSRLTLQKNLPRPPSRSGMIVRHQTLSFQEIA